MRFVEIYSKCASFFFFCSFSLRSVRAVKAAKVSSPATKDTHKHSRDAHSDYSNQDTSLLAEDNAWNRSISVLLSKPILALEFNLLKMQVEAPKFVVPDSKKSQVRYSSA